MTSIRRCAFLVNHYKNVLFGAHMNNKIIPSVFLHQSRVHSDCNLEIKMPSLSPTMSEGTIIKWLKKEGDTVSPGDVLCEIETDKAVVGFETEEEGILSKILVPEDSKNVKLGEVIAVMLVEGELEQGSTKTPEPVAAQIVQTEKTGSLKTVDNGMPKLCGPSVRNLLQEYGIKYSIITPTGPQNNLLKGDVLNYIKNYQLKPQPAEVKHQEVSTVPDITFIEKQSFVDIPHSSMRQTIARRLTQSKITIPHAYMSIDCKMDNISVYMKKMKNEEVDLTVSDFVVKCAAKALALVPQVNVVHIDNRVKKLESVDIAIAVATDDGLVTPVIRHADTLTVQQISECAKALTQKAKEGKLTPDELKGGSFSISDLGMFGISEFSGIINAPHVAILAVGASRFVLEDKGQPPVAKMNVTLSFDGRIIDDDDVGKFLKSFRQCIENPFTIVV